jgi:hypothetical protein
MAQETSAVPGIALKDEWQEGGAGNLRSFQRTLSQGA